MTTTATTTEAIVASPTATSTISEISISTTLKTNIVIIGCGWWTQGWHLPHLHANDSVNILAFIDINEHPKSNLNPNLLSLNELSIKYSKQRSIPTYHTIDDFILDPLSKYMDGIIIATPHNNHYNVGEILLKEGMRRIQLAIKQKEQQEKQQQNTNHILLLRPITILMEKPMTTNVLQAKQLNELVQLYHDQLNQYYNNTNGMCRFYINHSANYTLEAYEMKQSIHLVDTIRHIHLSFISPLLWIFDDPNNIGWNVATDHEMIGNGYCWGQSSHILSFLYYICPNIIPQTIYCIMNHSKITGADVSHTASIQCNDNITLNMNGTTLYPGNKHSEPPIAKYIRIEIYGSNGTMIYAGYDDHIYSGKCTFHSMPNGIKTDITNTFTFEELSNEGIGPQSLQTFLYATSSIHHNNNIDPAKTTNKMIDNSNDKQQVEQEEVVEDETKTKKQHRMHEYMAQNNCPATSSIGYKTIQTINAMYRSHHTKQVVTI